MEFKKARTIYDQIAGHVCENILKMRWSAGGRIPSVRELAVDIEVNPNTVVRAYASLQEQGVIVNRRGKGYYVAEDSQDRVLAIKKDEFLRDDLPALMKAMDLLNISMEELMGMIRAAKQS